MLTVRISLDRGRVGRGKAWIEKSGVVDRGQDAWAWLRHDERGRIVGLLVASIAMSIAMSLLATALARMVESRRAAAVAPEEVDAVTEADAHVEAEQAPGEGPAADAPAPEASVAATGD